MTRSDDLLTAATAQLREHVEPRAVEIADAVLKRSLAAPRPAELIRCAAPHDHVLVSTNALTGLIRARVDDSVADVGVRAVALDVDRQQRLDSLT